MRITILETRSFEMPKGWSGPIVVELGSVETSLGVRYFIRRGALSYPHGVTNEAFSRSYIRKVWREELKRYQYVSENSVEIA